METFLQQLVDNWVVILMIAIGVIAVCGAYWWFVGGIARRVAKAWLTVYEDFLERADKVPLLVELVRGEAHTETERPFESLLRELIVARAGTAAISLPCVEKFRAEKAFEEVLNRVLGEVSGHDMLKKNVVFLGLLKEFAAWPERLELDILAYVRTLRLYRGVAFGSVPAGYEGFEY